MTDQNNKLTRRDAIKLLGVAVGASVLANLPSKWSKPTLTAGVLPSHARSSCTALTIEVDSSNEVVSMFIDPNITTAPDVFPPVQIPYSLSYNLNSGPAIWYCQNSCVYTAIGSNDAAKVRITTTESFVLDFPEKSSTIYIILINLITGEYDYYLYPNYVPLVAGDCLVQPAIKLKFDFPTK